MENQEKLATQGTQNEDKQNKNTTQYVLDTTMRKQYVVNQKGNTRIWVYSKFVISLLWYILRNN